MKKIRVGSTFSGAGAFEYSLKKLNVPFETIFAIDNGEISIDFDYENEIKKIKTMKSISDKKNYVDYLYTNNTRKRNYMKEFYLNNHDVKDNQFFYDIKLFDGTDFKGKIDILVGGSPCQSFSTVGAQAGLEDARGTLFYEYARVLDETKPQAFIFENVRGLFNHDKGKTWKVIQDIFKSLGYKIKFQIINAKDYGLPQVRNRIFVIGFKNKSSIEKFNFPNPIKLKWKMHDFLESYVKKGDFKRRGFNDIKIKKSPLTEVGKRYFLTPGVEKYVMSTGTKNWHQKVEIDLPIARTILKTMANHHRAGTDNYVKEFGKIRMLTEREAFRIMGFGDDIDINISPARAYKIAGNSIAIDPLIAIMKEVLDAI